MTEVHGTRDVPSIVTTVPAAPTATGTVVLAAARLAWESFGAPSRRAVVLLHSGLGHRSEWRALVPILRDAGHTVIAYDRPGYGDSGPRESFELPPFDGDVAQLAGLLSALDIESTALVGHSDGGSVALGLAAARDPRVSRVAAVSAHAYVELKTHFGLRALAERVGADPSMAERLARAAGSAKAVDAWLAAWLRSAAWRWDMRDELSAVECPVLVVQGTDDEYATPAHARDIADHAGGRLELLPGVGHMVPRDAPCVLGALLVEFLGPAGP